MPVYKDNKGRYFIKTYVKDEFGKSKQITRRNKEWVGRKGKELALQEEVRLKNEYKVKKRKNNLENLTIEDAVKKYLEEQKKYNKESTVYTRIGQIKKHIIPYFAHKKLIEITVEDIEQWHKYLDDKKYSFNTKNRYHNVLDCIFKTCNIENNPVRTVGYFKKTIEEKENEFNKKKKLRYITYEEFKKFIATVKEPKWNVYFNLLFFTGMRVGEVQALTWEDIVFKNKKIRVTKTYSDRTKDCVWKLTPTKNLKKRYICIDDNLIKILKEYKKIKKEQCNFSEKDFILENTKKEPIRRTSIDNYRKKHFELSGVKKITNQEFRHSHVSLMVNEYLRQDETDTARFLIMMSERLGHTVDVMKKTYLHMFPDVQQPIVDLIDILNK